MVKFSGWDGRNLDSSDHISHMMYVNDNQSCPSSHPVRLPQITILMYFPAGNTNGCYLSSDRSNGFNTGPGATLHADWFGGWHEGAMNLWIDACMKFDETGAERVVIIGSDSPSFRQRKWQEILKIVIECKRGLLIDVRWIGVEQPLPRDELPKRMKMLWVVPKSLRPSPSSLSSHLCPIQVCG